MQNFKSRNIPLGIKINYTETPPLTIKSIRKLRKDEHGMENYEVNSPYEVEVAEEVVCENGFSHSIWFFAHADNDNSNPATYNSDAPIIYYFLNNLNRQIAVPLWNKCLINERVIYSVRGISAVLQDIQEEKQRWSEAGLKVNELDFLDYLKQKDYNLSSDIKDLRKEYHQAQNWLDFNYPKAIRNQVKELYISEKELEGNLELKDFVNLEKLACYDNKLTGLDLSENNALTHLYCAGNKLTKIDFSNNEELVRLCCDHNQLSDINFLSSLPNPEKLKVLYLYANSICSDLKPFSQFINLEELDLGFYGFSEELTEEKGNKLHGSLEPLKDLSKLKKIDICNTDVSSGLEYLPISLEEIYCSTKERPKSELKKLEAELRKFGDPVVVDVGEVVVANDFIHLLKEWRKANPDLVISALLENLEEKKQKITEFKADILLEREEAEEMQKRMDDFYRQNPPREDLVLQNILGGISNDYLLTNWENKQLKAEIQGLRKQLEVTDKVIEKEYQTQIEFPPKGNN